MYSKMRTTHVLDSEIRHSHRTGLALGEVDHGCRRLSAIFSRITMSEIRTLPRVDDGHAVINLDISIWKVLSLHKREKGVTGLECYRPVDQVEL
jgi:hypothetical protein